MRSEYMEWAKTCSSTRFNLATSGLTSVPLAEFPLRLKDLEVTAPGGYGYGPLQERLARHTGAPEECIVAATGASMANHLAMAAILSPGDEVLIEQPAYGLLLDVAHYLGARVNRLPREFERGFGVELGEVERCLTPATRLIVLTNLHNPSGSLISAEVLRGVGEMAQRVGARVLVDEVYLEMLFQRDAPFCFPVGRALSSTEDNLFIATNSLTKAYGFSGLRCGWILAAPELARRMWRLNDLFGVNPAHAAERMSVVAFDHLDQFRDRAQGLLNANRALVERFFDSRNDLECFRPLGGSVLFPRLKQGDPEVFFKLLRDKYETSVVPGRFFEMPQHFRIGIGGETEELRAGLERMSAALDEFSAR